MSCLGPPRHNTMQVYSFSGFWAAFPTRFVERTLAFAAVLFFFAPSRPPFPLPPPPRGPARAGRWVVLLLLSCAAAGPRHRKVPRSHARLLFFSLFLFLSARVGPPLPPLPFPHPLLACSFSPARARAYVCALVPANSSTGPFLIAELAATCGELLREYMFGCLS